MDLGSDQPVRGVSARRPGHVAGGLGAAVSAASITIVMVLSAPVPSAADAAGAVAVENAALRCAERILAAPGARTVLVAKEERILAEQARPGYSVDQPTNIKSASKSIVGALVGIAIRDGHLESVGQPVSEVLPDAVVEAAPGTLRDIRIEHLLTMTAGLETTSFENYGAWVTSSNWLRAAARQPAVAAPGERFIYSTGSTHLLGAALAEAAGQSLPSYARRVLFEPLGIQAGWELDPQGYAMSGNNLAMSPRDLLRFGQMMAAGGRWSERQIVPSSWVESSTSRHSEGWDRYGAYGYLWWLPPGEPELWMAAGFGSQLLLVARDEGVVVVVTASLESKGPEWDGSVLDAVRDFIRAVSRD